MNKTNLLKMRVESGECIYLGRKGQKVFVWDEEGNDLDVAKLPVYPRKYIKNKLESIPELELGFVFDYEGCDGGITGQGDETPADETPVVDETPADETPVDETPADDASTEEIETETEEVKVEEPVAEEIVEEALPTKLADLKELAEKLKKEAEVKTGKEIKVDIQSLRKKDDVIEKIGKLKELLK